MNLEAAVTAVVLLGVVVALVRALAPPAAVMISAVVVLVITGVMPVELAFSGFANPATISVAGLLVVAGAVQETGLLTRLLNRLLATARSERSELARLLAPVTGLSAGLLNTGVVATLASPIRSWAESRGKSPSRYLMPLSFASILGGVITVVGSSTTLLVSGLLEQSGHEPLSLLEITPVGLPVALTGITVVLVFAPRVLPHRQHPLGALDTHAPEYALSLRVRADRDLDGARVDRHLDLSGTYIARMDRDGETVAPLQPDTQLLAGDIVTVVGGLQQLSDVAGMDGLAMVDSQQPGLADGGPEVLAEAVIGHESPLAGRTPADIAFRDRYDAVIVAVHRSGRRVAGSLARVVLEPGDALLLLTDRGFPERWRDRHDFLMVASPDAGEVRYDLRTLVSLAVPAALVVVMATGWVSIAVAALAGALVVVAIGALPLDRLGAAIHPEVLLLVGGSIGLGLAAEESGLASAAASAVAPVAAIGGVAALVMILLATLLLTEVVSNVAAAAVMLPVALEVAGTAGADPRAFAIAVALAASMSFLTPIGYQTNTIVYAVGGYRYSDYWRLGAPVLLSAVGVALLVIPTVWQL